MTGPVPSLDQPPVWLVRAVDMIERGNWRFVIHAQEDVIAYGAAAVLLLIVRAVAASMRLQAYGRVSEAWRKLAEAALMLPRAACPLRRERGAPLVVLTPPPPETAVLAVLIWRVARVIWREQQDLLAIRDTTKRMQARDVLIAACVQYLVWVEWDLWTWASPMVDDDPPGIGRTAAEFRERATILRRFARPTALEVSTHVWRRVGGYRKLHSAALNALADAGDPPWHSENALAMAVPMRWASLEAHAHAVKWRAVVA